MLETCPAVYSADPAVGHVPILGETLDRRGQWCRLHEKHHVTFNMSCMSHDVTCHFWFCWHNMPRLCYSALRSAMATEVAEKSPMVSQDSPSHGYSGYPKESKELQVAEAQCDPSLLLKSCELCLPLHVLSTLIYFNLLYMFLRCYTYTSPVPIGETCKTLQQ